jgi:hypothetical protein
MTEDRAKLMTRRSQLRRKRAAITKEMAALQPKQAEDDAHRRFRELLPQAMEVAQQLRETEDRLK